MIILSFTYFNPVHFRIVHYNYLMMVIICPMLMYCFEINQIFSFRNCEERGLPIDYGLPIDCGLPFEKDCMIKETVHYVNH